MVYKTLVSTIILFFYGLVLAQNPSWPFETPQIKSKDTVIAHAAITLLYSEKHEQAFWVAYELLGVHASKSLERSNNFMVDSKIATGSATGMDYLKSGYDRGHLAPAADFGWSEIAMRESFYYSNMSPQNPSFNRGIWKRLESRVRNWSEIDSCIYIVTGPILNDSLKTIGPNNVSVPLYYYKVILDYHSKTPKGIGFIIPNKASSANLSDFATTIEEVEQKTGINFFPKLDSVEVKLLEKEVCLPCWTWTNTIIDNSNVREIKEVQKDQVEKDVNTKLKQAVQCTGITKSGKQCSNKTLNSTHRCHLHIK